jgi:hypothetical protein
MMGRIEDEETREKLCDFIVDFFNYWNISSLDCHLKLIFKKHYESLVLKFVNFNTKKELCHFKLFLIEYYLISSQTTCFIT